MSFLYLLLLLVNVGSVYSRPLSLSLDLDVVDRESFKLETTQLDNVLYNHITPKGNDFVLKVGQSGVKIWESSGYGSCVYALTALNKDKPDLLYIKVDKGYSLEHRFYSKTSGQWLEVNPDQYRQSVSDIRRGVKLEKFVSLNVFEPTNFVYFTVEYATKDRPYTYITPNFGYMVSAVEYRRSKLWMASGYGDRCVAVWAYMKNASYYMIRLLVTKYNDDSEIHTFFIKEDKWELVDLLDKTHTNKYAQKPSNFMYPNYKFDFTGSYPTENGVGLPKLDLGNKLVSTSSSGETELATETESKKEELEVTKESHSDLSGAYSAYKIYDDEEYEDEEELSRPVKMRRLQPESKRVTTSMKLNDHRVLHLADPTSRRVNVDLRYIDNVLYKIFKFNRANAPSKVMDTHTIWEAKSTAERCMYVLLSQNNGNSYTMYMIIDVVGEPTGLYFFHTEGTWVKISLNDYKKYIEDLKQYTSYYGVAMDLTQKVNNYNATVKYNDDDIPNYMFLPKKGYTWIKITDNNIPIWEADPYERCVALWSYKCFDKPYYLRIVVTGYEGSDLLSFMNVSGKWRRLTSYNELSVNKLRLTEPPNFRNPEYEFNQYPDYESQVVAVDSGSGENKLSESNELISTNKKDNALTKESSAKGNKEVKPNEVEDNSDMLHETFDSHEMVENYEAIKAYYSERLDEEVESYRPLDSVESSCATSEESEPSNIESDSMYEDEEGLEGTHAHLPTNEENQYDVMFDSNEYRREMALMKYASLPNKVKKMDLISIDVSSSLSNKYMVEALFDKNLRLMSYQPPAGQYFDLVMDAKNQLFYGSPETTLCYAVNMYFKKNYYYLCDLLIRTNYVDMTVYYRLEDRDWVCITKKEFLESLEELKARL